MQFLDEHTRVLVERCGRLESEHSAMERRANAEMFRAEAAEKAVRDMRRELDQVRLRLREARKDRA